MKKIKFSIREFLQRHIFALKKSKEVSRVCKQLEVDSKQHIAKYVVNKEPQEVNDENVDEHNTTNSWDAHIIHLKTSSTLGAEYILRRYVKMRYGCEGSTIAKLEKEGVLKPVKEGERSYYHIAELEKVFGEPFYEIIAAA